MCEPTGETWRPVVGWEAYYEVSDQGRIRRIFLPPFEGYRVLRPAFSRGGYPTVGLSCPGCVVRRAVHVLVAAAFIGPRPPGMEVCHNDGKSGNATLGNLRYDTPLANAQDQRRHGTHHNASKTHCSKGHEFTPENTRINVRGGRECRACRRQRDLNQLLAEKKQRRLRGLIPHPNKLKTHCPKGHPYDEENTYRTPSTGGRMCRTCMRERNRAVRAAERAKRAA